MKTIYCISLLILPLFSLRAQILPKTDTTVSKSEINQQLKEIKKEKIELHSDSTGSEPKKILVDTTKQNKYGDLLNDDPVFNKKYPIWKPIAAVFVSNTATFLVDRYVFKYDFSVPVGFQTWGHNIKTGWEWDTDRFGINFLGHPYSGSLSFSSARSDGYSFWEAIPFSIGGSLMWEYFGENTLPSYNDIINTPVNGAFLGEIMYRISSNILDDRSRGMQRFFRELAAGIVDPARGIKRLIQGKTFRRTTKEVYQKEPLNITMYGGVLQQQSSNSIETTPAANTNTILNLQLDYGNPFELRTRKPFDFFKFRMDFSFGAGRKIIDNVTGYGLLKGKNLQSDSGNKAMLIGAFQYYDYWDNKTFELGAIGFGVGVITKLPVSKLHKSNLYTAFHLALVPFAGSSTRFGPDTSQFRDYNFGGGLETKLESTINFGNWSTATIVGYYTWIHTYVGLPENNFLAILKPRVTLKLFKNLNIGYEEAFYFNNIQSPNLPIVHINRNEQKIFLMLYLEDGQRRGHYN